MIIQWDILIWVWFGLAAACFVGYLYFAYRMWKGRKPGVELANVMWNVFNICLRPSLLTKEGLRSRRHFFWCCLGFAILVAVPQFASLLINISLK